LSRVPEVTAYFWLLKALSTAMGEATSDFLVVRLGSVPAVLLGFVAFTIALARQLHRKQYQPWPYWTCVCMIGVFGTMCADAMHLGLHVPYDASTTFYAVVLAGVFITWQWSEKSLSMHSITTARRELFYWAAVVATFALGTAAGDFTAQTLHLGYLDSVALFATLIVIPAVGYRFFKWNPIMSFWTAYVLTRPLGASVADALGKPKIVSGVGLGDGWVALVSGIVIAVLITNLARRRPPRNTRAPAEAS
jgi:uncharacterized membrane-anchored protein